MKESVTLRLNGREVDYDWNYIVSLFDSVLESKPLTEKELSVLSAYIQQYGVVFE